MRPTCAHVKLDAIADNYRLACQRAPDSRAMAVIKANAYGHGMLEVARKLEPLVPAFAVAMIDEALLLREAGIRKPVLILQGVNGVAEVQQAAASGFWIMLHEPGQVDDVVNSRLPEPVRTWVKLDTGMHRLGLSIESFKNLYARLVASDNVHSEPVVCTHLACADELGETITSRQVALIREATDGHKTALSVANSAGILFWPESHAEWNRPGIMLYGSCPTGSFDNRGVSLRPVMTLCSEIMAVRQVMAGEGVGYGLDWVAGRPSVIGTIAIGYGDGYPRHAPSGTPVLVNGHRVPLTGRVSMDSISVDLTDLENVKPGDPVELWGENLSVNEVAASAGTIAYELLAGLTGRVPVDYSG